ncbi:MAG: MFS transporter [Chloroflexi bacterium]|nr:MFS transporter [Chloroflexota bacterium]
MNDNPPPDRGKPRFAALESFAIRNFRYLWGANGLYFAAQQMQILATQWLVLELTGARAMLGLVATVQAIAVLLLSPYGGIIAERSSRRNLLISGRAGLVALTVLVGILVSTDTVRLWHVFSAAVGFGVFVALTQPATQGFLFDLVGKKKLMNAIALNSTATSVFNMAGPALGATFIALVGIDGAYFASGGAYLIGILLMAMIPILGKTAGLEKKSPIRDIADGLRYMTHSPLTLWVFVIVALNFFGAFVLVLRPVYARDVLNVGVRGLGLMGLSFGAGSLVGATAATMLSGVKRKGYLLILVTMLWDVGMAGYGLSHSFALTLACEFLLGIVAPIFQASTMTMLQVSAPDQMRSRVISAFFMVNQLMFFGQFLGGFMADQLGDRTPLFFAATMQFGVLLFALFFASPLKNFGKEQEKARAAG